MREYYGKYRGYVVDNDDPEKLGRIKIAVPSVLGEEEKSWAYPCTPYAGPDVGLIMLPPKGANIWVEFEGGDPDYPIWVGCFWKKNELPKEWDNPGKKILKTGEATIIIDDGEADSKRSSNGVISILLNKDKQRIIMKNGQILIDNGNGSTVDLDTNTVKVNDDGLQVT